MTAEYRHMEAPARHGSTEAYRLRRRSLDKLQVTCSSLSARDVQNFTVTNSPGSSPRSPLTIRDSQTASPPESDERVTDISSVEEAPLERTGSSAYWAKCSAASPSVEHCEFAEYC